MAGQRAANHTAPMPETDSRTNCRREKCSELFTSGLANGGKFTTAVLAETTIHSPAVTGWRFFPEKLAASEPLPRPVRHLISSSDWKMLRAGEPLSRLRREGNIQARGQQHVILLRPDRRIGNVDIAKLVLPAEPLADLGDGAEGEGETVVARVLDIGIEIQTLRQHRALAQLLVEFFAQGERDEAIGQSVRDERPGAGNGGAVGVGFVGVVHASQEIKDRVVILNGVKTEATGVHLAQVKVLQSVAHEVSGAEDEQFGPQVVVVAESGRGQIRHNTGASEIVPGIDGALVKSNFAIDGGMHGIDCQSQIFRLTVAASDREAHVRASLPAMQ